MNATDRRKQEQLAAMSTDAIEHILGHLTDVERGSASPERPLGGLVHITGIGQVTPRQLEAELERRQVTS